MNNEEKIHLTKEALENFKKEYQELLEIKRPEALERVAETRVLGEMEENSEHIQAKEDLSFIDGRIAELEEVIAKVVIIEEQVRSSEDVQLGCKVTLQTDGTEKVFQLVGEWEADPINRKISHESPLGQALLGKKIGEQVEVAAPAGKLNYTVLKIE